MDCGLNPSSATYWLRDIWTRYLSLPLGFPQQEDGDHGTPVIDLLWGLNGLHM